MPRLPADCQSLEDVRREIDRIDEQIVALLGLRADYVRAAAGFKSNIADVPAPERQAAMLQARREWAVREGLDPSFVEKLYQDLIAYFILRETEHIASK